MPVQLLEQSQQFAFTGNDMVFKLQSTDAVLQPGAKSKTFFALNGSQNETRNFFFNYGVTSLNFFAKNTFTNNGLEYPTTPVDPTLAYYESVIAKLLENVDVSNNFSLYTGIHLDREGIFIEALEIGAGFEVTITGNLFFTFNSITVGANKTLQPNFKHYYEIWAAQGGDFEKLYSAFADIDDAYSSEIKVNEILQSLLEYDDIDLDSSTQLKKLTKSQCTYYIRYAQAYGTDKPIIKAVYPTETKTALLGGLDFVAEANYKNSNEEFADIFSSSGFMEINNGALQNRLVKTNEPYFLTYLNRNNFSFGPLVRVRAYFADGNAHSFTISNGFVNLNTGEKVQLLCGYDQLGLSAIVSQYGNGEPIVNYDITLRYFNGDTEQTINLTDPVNFIVNRKPEEYTRYFMFGNSLGNYSSLCTYGEGSSNFDRGAETAERVLPTRYKSSYGSEYDFDVTLKHIEAVATGYKSKLEIQQLADIFTSRKVLRVINTQAIAIRITTNNPSKYKDNQNLYGTRFEYSSAYTDAFFTEDTDMVSSPEIGDYQQYNTGYSGTGGGGGAPAIHNHDDRYYTKTISDGRYSFVGHTHTSTQITNFTEAVQDVIGSTIVQGVGIIVTYADILNALSIRLDTDYTDARYAMAAHTHSYTEITDFNTGWDTRLAVYDGQANGLAPLNANAKIDEQYLPDSILGNVKYKGTYNGSIISSDDAALNNQPLPASTAATNGFYFIVTAAFSLSGTDYGVGDWIISNGTAGWRKVDNTDAVISVFGRIGPVVANTGDYTTAQVTEHPSFLYYTNLRVQTFGDMRYTLLGHTHTAAQITDFENAVRATLLTGLATQNVAISATDNVITAFGKLQGQISFLAGGGNGALSGTGTTGYVPYYTSATTLANSVIYQLGSNVGIGTTNPQAKLHLNGVSELLRLQNDGAFISFYNSSGTRTGFIQSNAISTELAISAELSHAINFYTNNGDLSLKINSNGKVGIGTINPLFKQHNFSADNILYLEHGTDTTNYSGLYFGSNSNFQGAAILSYRANDNFSGNEADLRFYTFSGSNTAGFSGVERMRIDRFGGILIGTSTSLFSTTNRQVLEINGTTDTILALNIANALAGHFYAGSNRVEIGSHGARKLLFFTNSVDRAEITSTGDFLLGTQTARSGYRIRASGGHLEIDNGGADFHSGTYDPHGWVTINRPSDSSYAYLGLVRTGNVAWGVGINTVNQFVIGGITSGKSAVFTEDRFVISNTGTGTLGIGTSSFTLAASGRGLLEINGTTDSVLALKINNNFKVGLYATSSATILQALDTRLVLQLGGTERLSIATNGNFINLTSNLIIGTVNITGTSIFSGSNNVVVQLHAVTNNYLSFYTNTANSAYLRSTTTSLTIQTLGDLIFGTNSGTTLTEAMRIVANRNVLINTTFDDGQRLQIEGNIRATLGAVLGNDTATLGTIVRINKPNDSIIDISFFSGATELSRLVSSSTGLSVSSNFLPQADNTYTIGSGARRWTTVHATNGTIQTSDIREKTQITNLELGLKELLQIETITYNWKKNPWHKTLNGFSAQQLLNVVPSVVDDSNADSYGLRLDCMMPIVVNAIQQLDKKVEATKDELLGIIERQQSEIATLQALVK